MELRPRLLGKRPRVEVSDHTRAEAIQSMARALTSAEVEYERAERMLQDAARAEPGEFAALQALVAELAGGQSVEAPAPRAPSETFTQYADRWFDDLGCFLRSCPA